MPQRNTRDEAAVKIACIQMEPVVGHKEDNLRHSLDMIEEAAGNGAGLIVLPELCNSGYVFETREEAFALSETIPDGPTCNAWSEVASKHCLHIVAGINEREGEALYNSSVVIGPHGHVGTFRKVHLWNAENLFFEPGNLGFPVFKTPIGRIGTFICYDGWFPGELSPLRFAGRRYRLHTDELGANPGPGQGSRGHGQYLGHGQRTL